MSHFGTAVVRHAIVPSGLVDADCAKQFGLSFCHKANALTYPSLGGGHGLTRGCKTQPLLQELAISFMQQMGQCDQVVSIRVELANQEIVSRKRSSKSRGSVTIMRLPCESRGQ